MPAVDYSFKIDTSLKRQAEDVFASFGLSFDTALSFFLKHTVRKHSLPFELNEEICKPAYS